MTRVLSTLLGLGYATGAFLIGIQPTPNQILFTVLIIVSSIAFTFALDAHERMNELRRRGDNR